MKLKFNPNLDFQREAIDSIVGGDIGRNNTNFLTGLSFEDRTFNC